MNQSHDLPNKPHNLPSPPTPFIGRQDEISEIIDLLGGARCRLLTLTGAGGVGKTLLAMQAAAEMAGEFPDGVYFVPLQSVNTTEFLVPALADVLKFPLSGQEAPRVQLLNHLQGQTLLLVLDNFEQLRDGVDLLVDMLQTAPGVKLLVTSRVVLNIQEEWLYPVHGLPVPPSEESGDLETYSAIQLFTERARQVRPNFSLQDEGAGVVRICRLVEGLPLAIELAASWTRTLRCEVIAAEIERNLGFLKTRLRNVPDRHRSIQAVFDQSWQLMTPEERNVFKQLSVFQNGFRRHAAEEVAGASLSILSVLVDKSLLRWEPAGRYQIHELLHQYATEKLAQSSSGAVPKTRGRHCVHYLAFLAGHTEDISGGRQLDAAAEIAAELDNVRTAWQWAVERGKIAEIAQASFALYHFCQFGSRYLEGAQMFERAAQRLDENTLSAQPKTMLVLTCLGWFQVRLGRFGEAQAAFERVHAVYRRLDDLPDMPYAIDPAAGLGLMASMRGDYDEAKDFLKPVVRRSEQYGHLLNQAVAHYLLAGIHLAQGQPQTAQRHARAAYAASDALQDRWFMAYCLNELGNVAAALGDYEAATSHYQASYTLRKEFDDAEGMAVALNHLGEVAISQENYAEANRLYRQSLAIYKQISDKGGLATALDGLARAALARNDHHTARQYFQQALQIATEIRFLPLMLSVLLSITELLFQTGKQRRAVKLLALLRNHPAGDYDIKSQVQHRLARYEADLSSEAFARAIQQGEQADFETEIAALQNEWAVSPEQPNHRPPVPTPEPPQSLPQPLIEPLTPRELDVLRLVAAGLTNREIAQELVITKGTVKTHVHNIHSKLAVSNRTEAAARARALDLL